MPPWSCRYPRIEELEAKVKRKGGGPIASTRLHRRISCFLSLFLSYYQNQNLLSCYRLRPVHTEYQQIVSSKKLLVTSLRTSVICTRIFIRLKPRRSKREHLDLQISRSIIRNNWNFQDCMKHHEPKDYKFVEFLFYFLIFYDRRTHKMMKKANLSRNGTNYSYEKIRIRFKILLSWNIQTENRELAEGTLERSWIR